MSSVTISNSPAAGPDEEIQLLYALREHPELLQDIAASSEAERRNQRSLRERYSESLVRAGLSLFEARVAATGLLPNSEQLWLTRVGLEQSTAWTVAQHKARRFAGSARIYDLCSGIGVDSCWLAGQAEVVAVDQDAAMSLRCQWNQEVWQPRHTVQCTTANVHELDTAGHIVHVDPDRRAGSDRPVKRLEQYVPNLEWMQELTRRARAGAIKIGPASNFMQKFPDCEIELISLNGECREATVWFGEFAGQGAFRATVLPTGETIGGDPLSFYSPQAEECGPWIFDPDPAVVRSGMLDGVAELLHLERLDPEEEYLTGNAPSVSGFVTSFQVEAVLPNQVSELKKYLKTSPSAWYEVKCRRIPTQTSVIQKQLPKGTAPPRVILFARIAGKARIVVATRLAPSP